jgi:membrane protease YdiL (CAAX protease family)
VKKLSIFFSNSKPFPQLVGLFFLFLIGFILASGIPIFLPIGYDSPAAIRISMCLQVAAQLLTFFFPAMFFVSIYQDDVSQYLSFDLHGRKWLLAGVAVVIFLLLVPINDWITWWNDQWNLGSLEEPMRKISNASKTTVEKMLSLTTTGDLLFQLVVVALVPAVCEELFFRGALQQILRQWFGNAHVAIVVTALIFSLAHGDLYGLVPRFILGLLLGYLFYLSGSLLVNLCAHFFNNALIVVLYYLYHKDVIAMSPDTPLLVPCLTTLLCTLAAAALFALYFIKKAENDS